MYVIKITITKIEQKVGITLQKSTEASGVGYYTMT